MFNQLLPQRIDNSYRGHKLALIALMVVGLVLSLWSRDNSQTLK